MAIKESYLEAVFVKTLNGLLTWRDELTAIIGEAVTEAIAEAGEATNNSDELRAEDAEIESLQVQILELNKQRGRRELDAEQYNAKSRAVMEKLDGLFAERDRLAEQQSAATLTNAYKGQS